MEIYDGDYTDIVDLVAGVAAGDLLVHARIHDGTDLGYGIEPSAGALLRSTEAWQTIAEEHGTGPSLIFFSDGFEWVFGDFLATARNVDPSQIEAVFVRKNPTFQKSLGMGQTEDSAGRVTSYERSPLADFENPLLRDEPAGVERGDWYTTVEQEVVAVGSANDLRAAMERVISRAAPPGPSMGM